MMGWSPVEAGYGALAVGIFVFLSIAAKHYKDQIKDEASARLQRYREMFKNA